MHIFNSIAKYFSILMVTAVLLIPVTTSANNSKSELKVNRKTNKEITSILEKTKKYDPQKPRSQKLTKNVKDSNQIDSDQENLKVKFDLKNKKVKLQNPNKGDITVGVANQD